MRGATRIAWFVIVSLVHPVSSPPSIDWEPLVRLLLQIKAQVEAAEIADERAPESRLGAPWEDLKAEFDRICGQVQIAPSLSEGELRALIGDCKTLREALLLAENPQAKVFLKRLKMCEEFFEYSLEIQAETGS